MAKVRKSIDGRRRAAGACSNGRRAERQYAAVEDRLRIGLNGGRAARLRVFERCLRRAATASSMNVTRSATTATYFSPPSPGGSSARVLQTPIPSARENFPGKLVPIVENYKREYSEELRVKRWEAGRRKTPLLPSPPLLFSLPRSRFEAGCPLCQAPLSKECDGI